VLRRGAALNYQGCRSWGRLASPRYEKKKLIEKTKRRDNFPFYLFRLANQVLAKFYHFYDKVRRYKNKNKNMVVDQ
jgi:hypothetical protein